MVITTMDSIPFPAGCEENALFFKTLDPSTQEVGGLELLWKDPSACSHKSLHIKTLSPLPEILIIEIVQEGCPESLLMRSLVAGCKLLYLLGVGKIQSATSGNQEFSANGGFGFIDGDSCPGAGKNLRGSQSSGSSADNSDVRNIMNQLQKSKK